MPDSLLSRTYTDYSAERGTMTVRVPEITAVNFTATMGLITALENKTDLLSLGRPARRQVTVGLTQLSSLPATDTGAERETKWLVIFEDNVTKRLGQVEIPCAKRSDGDGPLTQGNTDDANLSHPAWQGWITAFQDVARSVAGNPVTVIRAKKVGRNL
jgi:hypothetical protein